LKKLVFLTNKQHVPTLFMAVDLSNFPNTDVWHCLYKLNKDRECPFVALRVIRLRSDFQTQTFKIQILDSLYSGSIHERLIALSKIMVIEDANIVCPRLGKTYHFDEFPFDLKNLLIRRRSRDSFRDFVIHYQSEQEYH
jgi:hypothetical protein